LVWPNAPFDPFTEDTLMTRPPLALGHAVDDLLGHVEAGVEVGAHHHVPVRLRHLLEGHVAGDAGVVHQHVNRTDFLHNRLDTRLAGVEIRHVARVGLEAIAHVVHGLQPFGCLRIARTVCGHHAETQCRELDADRFTQSSHTACYQCDSRHFLVSFY
jgi:hypothetical protein